MNSSGCSRVVSPLAARRRLPNCSALSSARRPWATSTLRMSARSSGRSAPAAASSARCSIPVHLPVITVGPPPASAVQGTPGVEFAQPLALFAQRDKQGWPQLLLNQRILLQQRLQLVQLTEQAIRLRSIQV